MARDLTSSQKKIVDRYYEHRDTIMLDKLGQIVSDLYLADSPSKADKLWKSAATALGNLAANDAAVRTALESRSVEGLAKLVGELSAPGRQSPSKPAPAAPAQVAATSSPSPAAAAAPARTYSPEELKTALKAFKKRMKLTRLDDESRLGRSPLTGGQSSGVVAIEPPRDYPFAVWEALVEQGKLKRAGRGFYQLVPGA